ncbi:ferritin-like domain-containing protein [Plantactinospora sp. ZYX-F-223]|uniref:ferritin-like domain-containing protein n=1 Tax=Plantactinospora sp. ZYX-F-223 TaxID=3144103 RepID=UPI0031FBD78F
MSEALAAALAAEHAAIYAYGLIGVRLKGGAAEQARSAEAAHRSRRDELVLLLTERGGPVPAAEPAYAPPFAVTDEASALRLAVEVEERTAAVWRAALPATEGAERTRALDGLTDAAVRATRWRRAAGVSPATVPFPGRPT